jgi:hypothetical protein
VLSNLALLEFDREVVGLLSKHGGIYRRYSDDILVILPGLEVDYSQIERVLASTVKKSGKQLEIQLSKSAVHKISVDEKGSLTVERVAPTSASTKLDYLGFNFDGRKMFIKSGTLSRLERRTLQSIRLHAKKLVSDNPTMSLDQLKMKFNVGLIISHFGRKANSKAAGTFYSYAKRSAEHSTEALPNVSVNQMRRQKKRITERSAKELAEAYKKFHT